MFEGGPGVPLVERLLHRAGGAIQHVGAGDEIVAHPRSVVGSLGVRGGGLFGAHPLTGSVGVGMNPRKGDAITALAADAPDLHVFHAGTSSVDGLLQATGGRVLCVTALGDSVRLAQQRALEAVQLTRFEGAHWRNDIGHRAIRH